MGFCFRCRNLSLKKWQGRGAFLCKRLRFALCGLFFLGKSYFWNQPVAMIEIFCMFVRPNAWTMDVAAIFQFLEELSRHNDREWFNAHKERYKHAQADFDLLLTGVIARIATFDESVRGIQAKDCTYRIYRDTRFSPDKTPYKTHFGGYINAKGKKSDHCGYYVHVENGNCMLAGGGYCLEPKVLKAVRQSVYDNIDEYREIVEDPQFKQYFPVIGETFLKTAIEICEGPERFSLHGLFEMKGLFLCLLCSGRVFTCSGLFRQDGSRVPPVETLCRFHELHHR